MQVIFKIKNYLPDILIQSGIFFVFALSFPKKCDPLVEWVDSSCGTNWKLTFAILLITFGINIIFRRIYSKKV